MEGDGGGRMRRRRCHRRHRSAWECSCAAGEQTVRDCVELSLPSGLPLRRRWLALLRHVPLKPPYLPPPRPTPYLPRLGGPTYVGTDTSSTTGSSRAHGT